MTIPCNKEEFLGEVKEFMSNNKGLRTTLTTVAVAILLQVCTFLYLWGGLTTTVKVHDKTIDKLVSKLENIKIVGYATAEGTKETWGTKGYINGH
mgnify:CR=1 FL=1